MASVFELAEEAVKSEAGRDAREVAGGTRPSEVTDAWSAIRSADVGGVVRMLHTALGSSTAPAEDPRVPPGDQVGSPTCKGGGATHSASQPEAMRDRQQQPHSLEGSNHAQQQMSFRQRLEELAREHEDLQAWCETLSTDNRKLRGHLASADDERDARQKELAEKQKFLEQEQRTVASFKESNRQVTNMLNMEKQNAIKEQERVKGLVRDKQREIKDLEDRLHVLAGGGSYNPGDLPGPRQPGLPPPGMPPTGLPMPGPPPPGPPPPGLPPRHPMPLLPCSGSGGCPGSDFIREYMQQDTAPSFDTPGCHAAIMDADHNGADRERGADPDRSSGAGTKRGSGLEDGRGCSARRSRSRSDSSSSSRGSSRRRRRRSRRGSGSCSGRSRSRRSGMSSRGGSRSQSSRRHRHRRRVRHHSRSGNRQKSRGSQQQQSRLQTLQMPQQSQLQPQLPHQTMPHHHMQPPMPLQPMPHWPPMGPMLPHGPVPSGDWWRGPRPCPPVGWAGPAC